MVAQFASTSHVSANAPQPLTPQPSVEETRNWLLALGLPPLPVAPAQDPYEYPKEEKANAKKGIFAHCPLTNDLKPVIQFTGKNPSYVDAKGKPHIVSHGKFQERMPSEEELHRWFANPLNGIGTLGSPKDIWLDFDVKNFTKALECKVHALAVAEQVRESSGHATTVEETHSGGWRVFAGVSAPPGFTNFALEVGGNHVGEALGKGRFTVLAPTIGPSGKPYVTYHRHCPETKPQIPNLKNIGVNPYRKAKPMPPSLSQPQPDAPAPTSTETPNITTPTSTPTLEEYPQLKDKVFELSELGTDTTRNILSGANLKGDRSDSLATAIRDLYGWENWCNANGIKYRGDTRSLALEAAKKMPPGKGRQDYMDEERVDYILKGIDANSCTTATEFKGGDDEGCWKRVLKLAGVKVSRKSNRGSCANAKDKVVPLRSSLPKAVGGTNDNPPKPPNLGGGRGGSNPDNDDVDWRPPEAYKGHLGVWVYPKNDEPFFDAKCNFDFIVQKEFERYVPEDGEPTDPDGGGLELKVTRASDGKTKTLLISSQDYATAKTFTAALKKKLGVGIKCRISDYDLQGLLHTKLREYHRTGGKVYTLASTVGQQPDGTRVFPNLQTDANGTLLAKEDSMWVFNPHIGELDFIPSPDIPVTEDPNALRLLLSAQREFAQANFMRFLLTDGWVAASLHEQEIMRLEKFMPVLNDYGDAGSGKTIALESALSLVWGDSGNGMIASASVSMAYERLAKTGSLPCCWDDPPSKSKKEQEALDEFVKRQYNKFPRCVRGNTQKPNSSMGITSNHCIGETMPATRSRIVGVFFPTVPVNKDAYPRLRKAMASSPGAFRSLLRIGYNQMAVHETRKRLIPHLQNAHERAADNWALVVWYTQQVVELAGLDIDVEAWVIENICPGLNESQSGLDSASNFFERLSALRQETWVGEWNFTTMVSPTHGRCLALYMPSLWKAIERSGDPPAYNRSVLENVLTSKGCIKGQSARFDKDRDSTLAYQRETHKGVNVGLNYSPPTKPQQAVLRALLVPERLWESLGYHPTDPDPDTPPPNPNADPPNWNAIDSDSAYCSSPVAAVAACSSGIATTSNVDAVSASDTPKTPCSVVAEKKEKEKHKTTTVKVNDAKNTDASDANEKITTPETQTQTSQNSATTLQPQNLMPETLEPQTFDAVAVGLLQSATEAPKTATNCYKHPQTPDLPPDLALASKLNHCDTWAQVQEKTVGVSSELFNEALELLEDNGARIRRLETDAKAQASTPKLENPTEKRHYKKRGEKKPLWGNSSATSER